MEKNKILNQKESKEKDGLASEKKELETTK